MSQHANMAGSAPTSSREGIQGSGATYRASVQKQSRTKSANKAVGTSKRTTPPPQNEVGMTTEMPKPAGYGSGHYVPNKA